MKIKKTFSVEESLLNKLEGFSTSRGINLSQAIEQAIRSFDTTTANLEQFVKTLTYYPDTQGAATYNKENMDLVLSTFKEYKDAQHFINKVVFSYAYKAMQKEVVAKQAFTEDGRVDINHKDLEAGLKKFIIKEDKKMAEKLGYKETDADGNPIYE